MQIALRTLALTIAVVLGINVYGQGNETAPAFPGAEGHGRYVTGGRGGKVYHVTNLNDKGTGSLRWALGQSGKKIIVFDVGGVIPLNSDLTVNANTTIAGQTAPAPGITLRYYTVKPNGNNIIIRFIRVRRGEEKDVNDGADAIWTRNKTGIIIDHCSLSWSIDEVASFYDNNNFTMQWCTIGESLNNAGHDKGAHGYGGIWGGKLASFHHNLICHVNNRSPRFNGARYEWKGYTSNKDYKTYNWKNEVQAENVDMRNCVVYNCGDGCYGGPGGGQINMVNNYYKTGPAKATSKLTQVTVGTSDNASGHARLWGMTSRYYLRGNKIDGKDKGWEAVAYDGGTYTIDGENCSIDTLHLYADVEWKKNTKGWDCVPIKLESEAPKGYVTTHTAEAAFNKVLQYAGASIYRDTVDIRYAYEATNGTATYKGSVSKTAGRIDKVVDCEGYTENDVIVFGVSSRGEDFDKDQDGIEDAWETANGLDPNDSSDADKTTIDTEKGWYTNLEVYLNSLAEGVMKAGAEGASEAFEDYYPKWESVKGKTAIPENKIGIEIRSTEYYNLQGQRVMSPKRGTLLIRIDRMTDGRKICRKIIYK
ncbi:MAG: pectate lyase [Bacteroidales bacterium]|nr:pectate lyase [Bacteroidales bacterium]